MVFQPPFQIQERLDRDGAARLTLTGELDVAAAEQLTRRIRDIRDWRAVRLDLASLDLLESGALVPLTEAVAESERVGGHLEIDPQLSDRIRSVIEDAGVSSRLWPEDHPAPRRPF